MTVYAMFRTLAAALMITAALLALIAVSCVFVAFIGEALGLLSLITASTIYTGGVFSMLAACSGMIFFMMFSSVAELGGEL